MSANKELVQGYFAAKGTDYASLLAEDVELVDWDSGVPATGAVTRGRAAFVENRGNRAARSGFEITRMTEEGNIVVAEGFVRGTRKDGGSWLVHFCDTFEIESGRVKRVSSHGADLKVPT